MAKKLTKEQAKELLIKEYVRRMVKKALKEYGPENTEEDWMGDAPAGEFYEGEEETPASSTEPTEEEPTEEEPTEEPKEEPQEEPEEEPEQSAEDELQDKPGLEDDLAELTDLYIKDLDNARSVVDPSDVAEILTNIVNSWNYTNGDKLKVLQAVKEMAIV